MSVLLSWMNPMPDGRHKSAGAQLLLGMCIVYERYEDRSCDRTAPLPVHSAARRT